MFCKVGGHRTCCSGGVTSETHSDQKINLRKSANSHVAVKRSSFWFFSGFLKFIQNVSRVLRIYVFDSCARILTLTSKSPPLCFCALCAPRGVLSRVLTFLSRCPFCGHKVVYFLPMYPTFFTACLT